MLAQVGSASLAGVESHAVSVEVNISVGLPSFVVVGLPHSAVREGRERVVAALSHVGHPVPPRRITVNLAPADTPKEGSAFDLPIAVAVLAGMGVVPRESVGGLCLVGELGLDGHLRPVRGALPIAAGCRARGVAKLLLPRSNAREAAAVEGVEVLGAETLREVLEHLSGTSPIGPTRLDMAYLLERPLARQPDLRERFDLVLARGVAKLAVLSEYTLPFCAVGGQVATWKHLGIERELSDAQPAIDLLGGRLEGVHQVSASGLSDDRVLVLLDKVKPTPQMFPRRPGRPAKQPITARHAGIG